MQSWQKPPSSSRTYHDPLHGAIALSWRDPTEALLIRLIDTPAFQRLRRIRQLGPASLTFHGAEASRFTHSLGVMAIARRAFDILARHHENLQPHRATVLCAALLHDVGHGPFSHTSEEIFGTHHEEWSLRILQEDVSIRQSLDDFDPMLVNQIAAIYRKQHPLPIIWQLISSQLDCDRLDYLMRDSYFTGASYGTLDLDRILLALDYDPTYHQLVVKQKGIAAIEHYLIVRYLMYAQVYNHPKNLAATWVLEKIMERSRELSTLQQLAADEVMTAWLNYATTQTLSFEHYLSADDGVMHYHIQCWQKSPDPVLADLCQRWTHRNLLKALDVTALDPEQQQQQLQRVQLWLQQAGWDDKYYTGLRTTMSRGYTPYPEGIALKTGMGLQDISQLSPLVETLAHPIRRDWLIYPREIDATILNATGSQR
jgi:HD superfamily phosphohydrolase